jgi:hypothetical protein
MKTLYTVIKEYKSPYPDPIVFQEGEQVKVGEEFKEDPDWRNWVWCEGNENKKAWVPRQHVRIDGARGTFSKFYNAMELSVQVGEEVAVSEVINGFGMAEKPDGAKGWVPMKNMELKPKQETRSSRNE